MLILALATVAAAWGSGFATCRIMHRQKGLETDRLGIVFTVPDSPAGLFPSSSQNV